MIKLVQYESDCCKILAVGGVGRISLPFGPDTNKLPSLILSGKKRQLQRITSKRSSTLRCAVGAFTYEP